jgi:glyoxylase-like metal-dependent hydrolase (beta-lactamase superfamily II)
MLATALALAATGARAQGIPAALPAGAAGRVVVNRPGGVPVHTYLAPEEGGYLVTSHVIETPRRLVVVDGTIHPRFAAEVAAYAAGLGKPVDRVLLSHFHPDHWLGLPGLPAAPLQASALNARLLAEAGPAMLARYRMPGSPPAVAAALTDGQVIELDGVALRIGLVRDTEAPEIATVSLEGAAIVQDIVYARVHPVLTRRDLGAWRAAVEALDRGGVPLLLVGHGEPTAPGTLARLEAYLARAEALLAANPAPEPVIAALRAEFPEFRAPALAEFLRNLYRT